MNVFYSNHETFIVLRLHLNQYQVEGLMTTYDYYDGLSKHTSGKGQLIGLCSPQLALRQFAEVGDFRVYLRFHPTPVG